MGEVLFFILFAIFVVVHCAPVAAVVVYVRTEARERAAWQEFALPTTVVDTSAYRSAGPMVTGYVQRAPVVVRLGAASSLVLGSMFAPGLAWALFGLMAAGAGLLSIPGLVIAGWLWSVGGKLLKGEAAGAVSAVRAASFSFYFNVFLVLGSLAAAVLAPREELVLGLASLVGVYALLSIGQAVLLVTAAQEVARHHGAAFEDGVEDNIPYVLRRLLARRREQRAAL